ncbi:saccharopine dehydrogenase family protein [Cystobacter fuscus]|uniref:saccharopine dehydrogenase family protein n=1 Tax=Cystobacter fuscus TaxID=43 RepID=UPI002B312AA6|nr:NAD(P)H-binding protein [Cystobacter fuscus]
MTGKLLIYGATGYSGRLISQQALASRLDFEVAGRDAARTRALADRLGVGSRTFSLDDADALRRGLEGVHSVLLCAGPFSHTARQVMEACIELKVHYLDITAELGVFSFAESKSEAASSAGIMLLPGVGWDVVPSDCLALHTSRRVPRPHRLRLALKHFGGISRGSARSAGAILQLESLVREEGQLVASTAPARESFDFGEGPEDCLRMPMGDLITAWKSTGVPNIEEFAQVGLTALAAPPDPMTMPEGPTEEERNAGRSKVVAEVTDRDGTVVRSLIDTPSGYTYTQLSAVELARRVVGGEYKPGFQTPASAFGSSLATQIGDARIIDL